MTAPSDPAVEAFLHLVDTLDAEAHAVTHAVVRAQATLESIVDDARNLLDRSVTDERAWADLGVRLLRHRANLVEALSSLVSSGGGPSPVGHGVPLAVVGIPVPPRPTRWPDGVNHHSVERTSHGPENESRVALALAGPPEPPRPRYRQLQPRTS